MKHQDTETLELVTTNAGAVAALPPQPAAPSPANILQAVVDRGITGENVTVVKELVAMCREARAEDAKAAFFKAFAAMRKDMLPIYADKEVHTKSGDLAFAYCSPQEIKENIEPILQRHGFCTMSGQTLDAGTVTVTITLMHEGGHSETRTFSVRVSPGNSLMSPSQCDAGATTTAERHLMVKMFGLRLRGAREEDDPRLLGEKITPDQAMELESRLKLVNGNVAAFLKLAGAPTFDLIPSSKYPMLDEMLAKKEKQPAK